MNKKNRKEWKKTINKKVKESKYLKREWEER
jgi:hypothetical protein